MKMETISTTRVTCDGPENYTFVVIGGGIAGVSCVEQVFVLCSFN